MIDIIVIEDDPHVSQTIAYGIMNTLGSEVNVRQINTVEEFLDFINLPQSNADILVSDIMLGEANGIDAAFSLGKRFPHMLTIFVTGSPELFYERVFDKAKPFGLLGKPIKMEKLIRLISDACYEIETKNKALKIRFRKGETELPLSSVTYIESQCRKLIIHTTDDFYVTYMSMKEITGQLDMCFVRCHQSYVINLKRVKTAEKDCFVTENGDSVPMSRKYTEKAKTKFFLIKGGCL